MTMAGGESELQLYLWPLKSNTKNSKSYFVIKDTKNTEDYKQTRPQLFHSPQASTRIKYFAIETAVHIFEGA